METTREMVANRFAAQKSYSFSRKVVARVERPATLVNLDGPVRRTDRASSNADGTVDKGAPPLTSSRCCT